MLIIANKPGYLANRIFLFSHFIAYSIEYNCKVINPAFYDYARYFVGTSDGLIPSYPIGTKGLLGRLIEGWIYSFLNLCARVVRRTNITNSMVSYTYLDWDDSLRLDSYFNPAKIHFVEGWLFRNEVLFQKYKTEAVKFFQLKSKYRIRVNDFILTHRSADLLVGVHIRHGDFQYFEEGRYFYSIETYEFLMKRFARIMNDKTIKFIISTNNREISEASFSGIDVKISPGHFVLDMYTLAECDYIFGPPSTYSMWASCFGNVPLYEVEDPQVNFSIHDFKTKY